MAVTLAFLVANPQAGMVASGGSLNHARKDINGQEFFYSKAYKGKNLFSPRDCQGHSKRHLQDCQCIIGKRSSISQT
jgi:hypothetical protein